MKKDQLGFLIKTISNKMRADADADLKQHDLTFSQAHMLFYLKHNGGSATQKELEECLKVSHPTVVGLVQRLESHHYVNSRIDEDDKRNRIISLTPEAMELEKELRENRKRSMNRMMTGLEKDEIQELLRLLRLVCENVERCNRD